MSNRWNHSICDECWKLIEPDRDPVRFIEAETEKCCLCGKEHKSGIYRRGDPKFMPCKGVHDE